MLYGILLAIFVLIFIYSVYYQTRCLIIKINNDVINSKKANSITIAQSVLKNNNTNIYLVKTNNSRRSHYDIKRNAIRLDDRDYDSNYISCISNSIALAINAVITNKGNRFIFLLFYYISKISIVLCLICIYLYDLVFLTFSMIFLLGTMIFKYINLKKEIEILNIEIDNIKKEYKINDEDIIKVYNSTATILYNELSFNLLK